jgi:hypothetical protein
MTRKTAERAAFETLNGLIDDQLRKCTEPSKDEWVKRNREQFFKLDSAGHVVEVMIEGSQYVMPSDKWFDCFAEFKRLEVIHLDWCGSDITGRGFRRISGLKRLKALNLWTCKIKDSAVAHLRPLKTLEWLRLCETSITNKSLKVISELPRIRGLELFDTRITDRGLVHLRGCRKLKHLDLCGTEVTESGVRGLGEHLPHCYIQGAGLSINQQQKAGGSK